jgi:AbrB family looped-hinge helix DNA binding protein
MVTTVTGKNQVTVPAAIARRVGIRPGTKLEWRQAKGDMIHVRVLPDPARIAASLRGRGKRFLDAGTDPIGELIQERIRDDQEREGHL